MNNILIIVQIISSVDHKCFSPTAYFITNAISLFQLCATSYTHPLSVLLYSPSVLFDIKSLATFFSLS